MLDNLFTPQEDISFPKKEISMTEERTHLPRGKDTKKFGTTVILKTKIK